MWFKYYNIDNLYKIQIEDLSILKLNDSSILEKRILKKAKHPHLHTNKKLVNNEIIVLDKSFKNLNIFKNQNKKTITYKKTSQLVMNKKFSLFLIHNYLKIVPGAFKILANKNALNSEFTSFNFGLFKNNIKLDENTSKKFNFNPVSIQNVFINRKKLTKYNYFENNFLLNVKHSEKIFNGGSGLKKKNSFFWSTTSLLNKGAFNAFLIKKLNTSLNKFILI